jgi:hypothetical protein
MWWNRYSPLNYFGFWRNEFSPLAAPSTTTTACSVCSSPSLITTLLYLPGDFLSKCSGNSPMHRVTVKVKFDSSLLIKISVSIKVILVLVEGFSLLQNLNIKLPSTFVLRRKEGKRVLYFVPALMEVLHYTG